MKSSNEFWKSPNGLRIADCGLRIEEMVQFDSPPFWISDWRLRVQKSAIRNPHSFQRPLQHRIAPARIIRRRRLDLNIRRERRRIAVRRFEMPRRIVDPQF